MNATLLAAADRFVNRLVHEYITASDTFANDLQLAEAYSRILVATLRRLRDDAGTRLGLPADQLPGDIG